ncbi:hypothetical protein EX30DRAFT_342087 [Ascodesmis nigricans]|uniref:Uncharacterized protein n=1 Tax=Ascodesmis nigricans TaxID=341454 RepID=A0A4V6RHD6_9PEZI|nr:hypothetical protein EX30DRAFT_342087 [Ascodesmis nigricans]
MYASQPHHHSAMPRSSLTPPSLSPPSYNNQSPHLPAPFRQLHAPKSPMYRPAALRPTQVTRPPSSTASTSPKSVNGELNSARAPSVFGNESEEDDLFDDSTIIEIEDGEEGGRVTGPPKRTHWKVSRLCPS